MIVAGQSVAKRGSGAGRAALHARDCPVAKHVFNHSGPTKNSDKVLYDADPDLCYLLGREAGHFRETQGGVAIVVAGFDKIGNTTSPARTRRKEPFDLKGQASKFVDHTGACVSVLLGHTFRFNNIPSEGFRSRIFNSSQREVLLFERSNWEVGRRQSHIDEINRAMAEHPNRHHFTGLDRSMPIAGA